MIDIEIEIFRAGTHQDMGGSTRTFGDEALDQIASYDASNPAPLVIGHPRDDSPAYGWVESIKRVGDRLVARVKSIAPEFTAAVRAGAYRRISVALFTPDAPANPHPGKWQIRHVGFLGGAAPAIPGLALPKFAAGQDQDVFFVEYGMDLNKLKDVEGDITLDAIAEALGVEPTALQKLLEPPQEGEDNPPKEDDPPKEVDPAFADLSRRYAEQQARLVKIEQERRREQAAAFCANLIRDGRPMPIAVEAVVDLLCHVDDAEPVQFSTVGKKTPRAVLESLLTALPKQVDFEERAKGELNYADGGNPQTIAGAIAKAQATGLSFVDAVAEVMGGK